MPERIESVDSFRVLAIVCVIIVHTQPFAFAGWVHGDYFSTPAIVHQLSRFPVLFFFTISGYFWGRKITDGSKVLPVTLPVIRRLLSIFLFWSVVYAVPYDIYLFYNQGFISAVKHSYWNLLMLYNHPWTLFFSGTKIHLWFLISLSISIATVALFIYANRVNMLLIFSILLYIFGVLAGAYGSTLLGMHDWLVKMPARGPFQGPLCFSLGYILSRMTPDKSWVWKGCVLIGLGYILHFSETYVIWKYFDQGFIQDYVFGTFLVGAGFSMLALSGLKVFSAPFISWVGRMTLGVYGVHYIFVDILGHFQCETFFATWEVLRVFSVLGLSVALVLAMSRTTLLRRFVV